MQGLCAWAQKERNPDKVLLGALYDPDELIRWRTIEAFGEVAVMYDAQNQERVRVMLRGLFWIMNDESGGLGWNAPEAIGQVLYRLPNFIPDFGRILASFTVEEPFERGTHWALTQIVPLSPKTFEDIGEEILSSLKNQDPYIRAYAAQILPYLPKDDTVTNQLSDLIEDKTALSIYDTNTGAFTETTVAQTAKVALS
jgi:hypothetical protein